MIFLSSAFSKSVLGRREFLDFMNEVTKDYPVKEMHVILDNLSAYKPRRDLWLKRHPNVHFHYTHTHASWLNQIECWLSILTPMVLNGVSFISPSRIREAIDRFINVCNKNAYSFEWRKKKVYPREFKKY